MINKMYVFFFGSVGEFFFHFGAANRVIETLTLITISRYNYLGKSAVLFRVTVIFVYNCYYFQRSFRAECKETVIYKRRRD